MLRPCANGISSAQTRSRLKPSCSSLLSYAQVINDGIASGMILTTRGVYIVLTGEGE